MSTGPSLQSNRNHFPQVFAWYHLNWHLNIETINLLVSSSTRFLFINFIQVLVVGFIYLFFLIPFRVLSQNNKISMSEINFSFPCVVFIIASHKTCCELLILQGLKPYSCSNILLLHFSNTSARGNIFEIRFKIVYRVLASREIPDTVRFCANLLKLLLTTWC